MLSNGAILETSLVVASIQIALLAFAAQIPTRERVRVDVTIFIDSQFVPYVAISLALLFLISALAIVNSFFELESLCFVTSFMLLHSVGIFLPIVSYSCIELVRMVHPH